MKDKSRPLILIVGGSDVNARIKLIEHLASEIDFCVFGSSHELTEEFDRVSIPYTWYPLSRGVDPISDIRSFFYLYRCFCELQPDLVHTFDTKPGIWARLAARWADVPVIIGTLPGLGSLYSENDFRTRLMRLFYQPLQKLACHLSNLTIFQNPDDAEQFIQEGVVDAKKAIVILGSGVDTEFYDGQRFRLEQRKQLRIMLGIDMTSVVVTMVSRLILPKGVLDFSQMAQAISTQYPNVVFLLIGSDDHESVDALTAPQRELVVDSTNWLGVRHDVPDLLAITDIFVLPTYYREGIPRVLLEAASMSIPIVATQVPGCTEVVIQNVTGFLVPVRNVEVLTKAVMRLINNRELRHEFGKEARQRAITHFDTSEIACQTLSIYRELLSCKEI
jgi:glycosyltransferase involved in cell wall biosynthesis